MARPNSSRDPPPPTSSNRDPNRTTPTENRHPSAAPAEPGQTSASVPRPQDAQRSETKKRLDHHRKPHSFPDYGSVKGAVRMPPPFSSRLKSLAPPTHVDTLNSTPAPHQARTAPPPFQTPATKRSKIRDARGPDEDIVEVEHETGSRQERYGSQSSFAAHSASPGVAEFQSVEASTCRPGRPNRRGRKQHGDHPTAMNHHGRIVRNMEPIDSFDELAPVTKPPASRQRTARLLAINDAADAYILGKPSRVGQHQHNLQKSKTRPGPDVTSDHDELADESPAEGPPNDLPKRVASSVSRRGDIKPTKWASTPRPTTTPLNVRVEAAVCQPNLRFTADKEQPPCFLRPIDGRPELRAFMESGNTAESYPWLKITGKARTLTYHPDSNLIKINQPKDQTLAISIGALMILRLGSSAEAVEVADWASKNSRINVVQEKDSLKLHFTWDKTSQEVGLASNHASGTKQPDSPPAAHPRRVTNQPSAAAAPPSGSPRTSSRTLIRSQMRVSAHNETPLPTDGANGRVSSSSRSLRSRTVAPREQVLERPRSPSPPRWSEENPDWAKDWEMPLVLERTTVNKDDIPRLDEGECLNDNLIGYGLRYLFNLYGRESVELKKRVFIHNSYFYERLKGGGGAAINYDGVKSWTSRVDLLSYDYIVVPVNEHFHWWVAIICNAGKLDPDARAAPKKLKELVVEPEEKGDVASSDVEMADSLGQQALPSPKPPATTVYDLVQSDIVVVSDDKNDSIDLTSASRAKQNRKQKAGGARTYDPEDPRIITLDSLGASHPQAVSHLKKYLMAEFADKRNKVLPDYTVALGMKAANIPQQDNVCDCGVYLLGYVQEFLRVPDQFIRTLLKRETPDWDFNPSDLRVRWRDTILCEQKSYQSVQLAKKKPAGSSAKPTPKPSTEPSRENSEAAGAVNGRTGPAVNLTEQSPSPKSAGTPARPEIRESNGHPDHLAKANGTNPPHSSPRASANSPQQTPQQKSPNHDTPFLPHKQTTNNAVLPSIEPPEVEEITPHPARHNPSPDEPHFLGPLASSSSSSSSSPAGEPYAIDDDDDDDDVVAEIPPRSFYSAAARATPRKRTSPASLSTEERRRKMARTRPPPAPAPTTASHFVVDGSSSPESEGVVERAEMVRDEGGTIDLTEG